jgi:hypothetical protein
MIIEQTAIVKELALAFPQTTRIFERLGIDYCCGGVRALGEACQLADVPLETAMRALNEAVRAAPQPGRNWSAEPLTALITHILEGHHVFTRNELDRLPKLFAKVWAAHGERHPKLLQRLFLPAFALFALFASSFAQQPAQPQLNLPLAQLQREFKSLPFKPGEKLVYEVKFTKLKIAAKVGEVTFEYVNEWQRAVTNGEPVFAGLNVDFKPDAAERFFRLRGSADSKGILTAIIGLDVHNRYETLVDKRDFATRLHFRTIKEGKKQQAQAAQFERAQQGVTFTSNDLSKPEAVAQTKSLPRAEGMLDLLSAFYFVRLQKLKEGELLRFPVSDDGENYVFEIVVGRKEQLKTDCGKINTIKIMPKLFGPGQLIARPGTMTMWLTDNKAHVPVKLIAKTGGGTVSARLLNFKNNCQIAEPGKEELQ